MFLDELFVVQRDNMASSRHCSSKERFLTGDSLTYDSTTCEVSQRPTLEKKATHPPHPQQNFTSPVTSPDTVFVILTNLEQEWGFKPLIFRMITGWNTWQTLRAAHYLS